MTELDSASVGEIRRRDVSSNPRLASFITTKELLPLTMKVVGGFQIYVCLALNKILIQIKYGINKAVKKRRTQLLHIKI